MEQTAISNSNPELGDNESTSWYCDQNQFNILMTIIELLAPTENEYPILIEREQLTVATSLDGEFSQNSASGDSGTGIKLLGYEGGL